MKCINSVFGIKTKSTVGCADPQAIHLDKCLKLTQLICTCMHVEIGLDPLPVENMNIPWTPLPGSYLWIRAFMRSSTKQYQIHVHINYIDFLDNTSISGGISSFYSYLLQYLPSAPDGFNTFIKIKSTSIYFTKSSNEMPFLNSSTQQNAIILENRLPNTC